jgi:hypothetical protein
MKHTTRHTMQGTHYRANTAGHTLHETGDQTHAMTRHTLEDTHCRSHWTRHTQHDTHCMTHTMAHAREHMRQGIHDRTLAAGHTGTCQKRQVRTHATGHLLHDTRTKTHATGMHCWTHATGHTRQVTHCMTQVTGKVTDCNALHILVVVFPISYIC